jgi:hypothetical protein
MTNVFGAHKQASEHSTENFLFLSGYVDHSIILILLIISKNISIIIQFGKKMLILG